MKLLLVFLFVASIGFTLTWLIISVILMFGDGPANIGWICVAMGAACTGLFYFIIQKMD